LRLTALEDRTLMSVTVTEFASGISPNSLLDNITRGPDGNLWFVEGAGIGRITPAGVVTEFHQGISQGARPLDITSGPDGNLWFTEPDGNGVGRITPAGVVTEFHQGISPGSYPYGISAGPDGNLWFTENDTARIGRITPAGVVTEFSQGITAHSDPLGITRGPDGNLWFTELTPNQIGRITPTGVVTEFHQGISPQTYAFHITAGPDGNLWFAEYNDRIGRITPAGVITEFSQGITHGSAPTGITTGPDGNLWFTEYGSDQLGRITPTGIVTEFHQGISANSNPDGITLGPDGNLWFTEYASERVSRAALQDLPLFAVGGAPGRVRVYQTDNSLVADFQPFGPAYTGGVSVAVADVNGDGFPDLIVGAISGNSAVHVYDGKALAQGTFDPLHPDASFLAAFFAYGMSFNVGANVAAGDIEHNGFADIVTGATAGNPDVRVYRGFDIAHNQFDPSGKSLVAQWFPYALQLNVGANVAVGDVNGDGYADVVTGATAGNPDVRVFSGQDIAHGTFAPNGQSLLAQFFAYGLNLDLGAFVAVGDTTGSGFGDIITGATTGNPDVRVYSGQAIANHTFDNNHPQASLRDEFFAYALNFNVGATVASADFENTGKCDILTGASAGSPQYRVVRGNATGVQPPALFEGIPGDLQGAITVGA
jgi:streptogramin lyase